MVAATQVPCAHADPALQTWAVAAALLRLSPRFPGPGVRTGTPWANGADAAPPPVVSCHTALHPRSPLATSPGAVHRAAPPLLAVCAPVQDPSGRVFMFDRAGNLYYDTEDPRTGLLVVGALPSFCAFPVLRPWAYPFPSAAAQTLACHMPFPGGPPGAALVAYRCPLPVGERGRASRGAGLRSHERRAALGACRCRWTRAAR